MIESTSRHRAPQGIVLGLAIMTVFYLGIWVAVRSLFATPAYLCPAVAHPIGMRSLACNAQNPTKPADCRCLPH